MKTSKLSKYKTATGKVWAGDTELSQLDGFANYTVASAEEYKSQLDDMNSLDLQRHATEVGEFPRDNRETLISNLLKKFQERQ